MATIGELKTAQNAANAKAAATTGEEKINAMYDAQKESQLKQLESAYNQSKSEYTAAQEKIAPEYQNAANALAVEYERNRRNFNQQAAATGLNIGTGAQARLAHNSAYQRDYGGLRASESEAQAEAARQLANFEAKYQSDVATAIANNDYQRAAALYDEYKNAQNMELKNAQILAEFGDFSGYAKIYGQEQANNMFIIWATQNPDLAYSAGRISETQYNNIISGNPINSPSGAVSANSGDDMSWLYDPTLGVGYENSTLPAPYATPTTTPATPSVMWQDYYYNQGLGG